MNKSVIAVLIALCSTQSVFAADSIIGKWQVSDVRTCSSGAPYVDLNPGLKMKLVGLAEFKEDLSMNMELQYSASADQTYLDKIVALYTQFKVYLDSLPEGADKARQMKQYEEGMKYLSKLAGDGFLCSMKTAGSYEISGDLITYNSSVKESSCGGSQVFSTATEKFAINGDQMIMQQTLTSSNGGACPSGDTSVVTATRVK